MRRTHAIATFAAALFTVGGVAGIAQASGDEPTDPGVDIEAMLEILTPEQIGCVASSMPGVDATDTAAVLQLMTDCGITMEQLMQIGGMGTGTDSGTTTDTGLVTDTTLASDLGELFTVAQIIEQIGLDSTELSCISDGLTGATFGDDAEALTILQSCNVSLAELLQGLVAVGSGSGTDTPATLPALTPTTTTGTGTGTSTGDPIADIFVQQFEAMGLTVTQEQASCLAEQVTSGAVDPNTIANDTAAIMNLLTTCNIDPAALLGG